MSYAYHAISSYFNRDNVALPGMVSFFRYNSEDEREHAQKLMNFQVGLTVCTLGVEYSLLHLG